VFIVAIVFMATHWPQIQASLIKPETFDPKIQTIIDALNQKESPVVEPIPKIIIQIWIQKDGGKLQIPGDQIEYMNKMRQLNPGFQHLFFNNDDVQKFFESNYPEYYDTYKKLPAFIQKLDFFRYLAVYHYGGFYFDMDVDPIKPLDADITNHHAVFPIDEYGDDRSCSNSRMMATCKKGRPFLLGQYAFGTTAKHPFLKYVVDKIRNNVDTYIDVAKQIENAKKEHAHYFVFKTTGPDFITDCYNRYNKTEQFFILSNGKRQVFGDYATHNYKPHVWRNDFACWPTR
jgi:mannosyltransferase OCH1-like enzyme